MTLVEVMVAMLVLTVVLSALASVLTTSLRSLHGNENRARANGLANEVLEGLQERRWYFVGFHSDDFGAETPPANTVFVDPADVNEDEYDAWVASGNEDWDASARVLPDMHATRDGTTYDIETRITWQDDGATTSTEDYKQFEIIVRWQEFGRQHDVTHQAQRTPSSSEQDSGVAIRSVTLNPSWARLDTTDDGDAWWEVDADTAPDWSNTYVQVIVRLSGTYGDTPDLTIVHPDGSTDGSHTLVDSGPSEYTTNLYDFETMHGETTFTVSVTQDGQTATKSAVTQYVWPTVAIEDPPRLSPSDVCADPDNSYRLTGDLTVAVDITGLLITDTVDVTTAGGSGQTFEAAYEGPATTWAAAQDIGSEFAAVLPAGTELPPGDDSKPRLQIGALREFDGASSTIKASIPVCGSS